MGWLEIYVIALLSSDWSMFQDSEQIDGVQPATLVYLLL